MDEKFYIASRFTSFWRHSFTKFNFKRFFNQHISDFFPPVMPVIVPFPLNEKPAHMDQFLSMTCAVSDGDLPLNIFWTFNNQPITSDIDVSISKLGKRTSVLTIDSVNGHHMGQYTCHGRNEAGSTSYSTELKVIGVFYISRLFPCSLYSFRLCWHSK